MTIIFINQNIGSPFLSVTRILISSPNNAYIVIDVIIILVNELFNIFLSIYIIFYKNESFENC